MTDAMINGITCFDLLTLEKSDLKTLGENKDTAEAYLRNVREVDRSTTTEDLLFKIDQCLRERKNELHEFALALLKYRIEDIMSGDVNCDSHDPLIVPHHVRAIDYLRRHDVLGAEMEVRRIGQIIKCNQIERKHQSGAGDHTQATGYPSHMRIELMKHCPDDDEFLFFKVLVVRTCLDLIRM